MYGNRNHVGIFPADSRPYDLSYEEWVIKWWQRMFSIPVESNPANDETGKNCAQMQSGPVWFLAGTVVSSTVIRECTLPAGKAVLVPIINTERSTAEMRGAIDSQLTEFATNDINQVNRLDAIIDGVKILDFKTYRIRTLPFHATISNNNFMQLAPGHTRMVSDGFWILLKPLSVGKHTVHFIGMDPNLQLDVTYNLSVRSVSNLDYVIRIVLEEIKKSIPLLCRQVKVMFDDFGSFEDVLSASIPSLEMEQILQENGINRAKIKENIQKLFYSAVLHARRDQRSEIKPRDVTSALVEINTLRGPPWPFCQKFRTS